MSGLPVFKSGVFGNIPVLWGTSGPKKAPEKCLSNIDEDIFFEFFFAYVLRTLIVTRYEHGVPMESSGHTVLDFGIL